MTETFLTPTVQPPFPLRWGFTTRHTAASDIPARRIQQVHGCGILPVESDDPVHGIPEGDGLWTTTLGTPIGVRVADCVPVILAGWAADRPWIAALHAGWRGAAGGILRRGVEIHAQLGGRPEDLYFAFGPCIQPCHFEVGPEVAAEARRDSAWRESFARPGTGDRLFLDLHGLLRAQALSLGLDPAKEGTIRRCTCCEPEVFYSYRQGEREGRQWGLAELLP